MLALVEQNKPFNGVILSLDMVRGAFQHIKVEISEPQNPEADTDLHAMGLCLTEPELDQILGGEGCWLIRNACSDTRGRCCIIQSSPWAIVGEAKLVDCLLVGHRDKDGVLRPSMGCGDNFIGNPHNSVKHGLDLSKIQHPFIYALVLDCKLRYTNPISIDRAAGRGGTRLLNLHCLSKPTIVRRPRLDSDSR